MIRNVMFLWRNYNQTNSLQAEVTGINTEPHEATFYFNKLIVWWTFLIRFYLIVHFKFVLIKLRVKYV